MMGLICNDPDEILSDLLHTAISAQDRPNIFILASVEDYSKSQNSF